MAISVFDIYEIGVGPSSSRPFGPLVASERFPKGLEAEGLFDRTARAQVERYASMPLTGKGTSDEYEATSQGRLAAVWVDC
jgi:L-serine dehydratase